MRSEKVEVTKEETQGLYREDYESKQSLDR